MKPGTDPPADPTQASPIGPEAPPRPRAIARLTRILGAGLVFLLLLAGMAVFWFHQQLRGSLPALDGESVLTGLSAPVAVERDSLGIPTLRGAERLDLSHALGFVHAQERFFQMDLSRRQAAGELSELVGEAALPLDRKQRLHRFRARSRRRMETLPPDVVSHLEAYAKGVDAGLEALAASPFEYLVLGASPESWQPEDSLLVIFAMFFELHDEDGSRESSWGLLNDLLGPEMFAFLAPWGTEWDAPVLGGPMPDAPLPGPEVFDLRTGGMTGNGQPTTDLEERRTAGANIGSNNWAVAGAHTTHGGAILANDMHLGLSVPNIWFRVSLAYPDPGDPADERRITGITLPGVPMMVAGSTGRVAWGFTNSYGDWADLVVLEPAPGAPESYLTPDGPRQPENHTEVLLAKGGLEETLEIEETIWGPIIDEDHLGRRRALRWTAHDPEAVALDFLYLEGAHTVEDALEIAGQIGAPPQNFVVADSAGRIGWTIMGAMPKRFGHDGRLPSSWADGTRGWDGYLEWEEKPRIVDPPTGRIWTANARVVDGDMLEAIGHGGYDLGARAGQIRDDLLARETVDEADLLAIQLDDRALFLERWRELLLETLDGGGLPPDPRHEELRHLVEDWSGSASVDSAGYRLVRSFRLFLEEQIFDAITAACEKADERFDHGEFQQSEGPLWRLVSERPAHLLNPRFETWDEQLSAAVGATLDYFAAQPGSLADRTWGERNTSAIRHPLSRFVPLASRWLDMPAEPLPGDSNMPRVQGPTFGASERMVVSPGREEGGIFHMPTGQSGHPLSPHYGDAHRAWVRGAATPFLPGETVHSLSLVPGGPE